MGEILSVLDADALHGFECYFAGGTRIALDYGEFEFLIILDNENVKRLLPGAARHYHRLRPGIFGRMVAFIPQEVCAW